MDIHRVFSPVRERANNLSLMKKHCFFTVFMKLQNNDIITFLKILQDYMEHLLRYLFTKIINKTSIFITFSAVLIGYFIFSELTASIMNIRDWVDSSSSTEIKIRKRIYKIAMNSDYIIVHRKLTVSLPGAH